MTVDEHIGSLVAEANQDLGAAETLAKAGYWAHSLFFAHLVLEKLCKALWMKSHQSTDYPYTHNIVKLIKTTDLKFSEDQIRFYSDMNQFQTKGRYPDTLHSMEQTITAEIHEVYFNQLKIEILWLTRQLQ